MIEMVCSFLVSIQNFCLHFLIVLLLSLSLISLFQIHAKEKKGKGQSRNSCHFSRARVERRTLYKDEEEEKN
jgi:hypothetical protein